MQFPGGIEAVAQIYEIGRCGGVRVPRCLAEAERLLLLHELKRMTFVPQKSEIPEYSVQQNFSAVREFLPGSSFLAVRQELEWYIRRTAKLFEGWSSSSLFTGTFHFNDLVAQRYAPVKWGITPHRDGKSKRNLIAVFVLEGDGRFCLCDDRAGTNPRELEAQPGDLILMRGPGFLGQNVMPFHFLRDITVQRTTFALRQDDRPVLERGV
jgi:hypothetical protein